MTVFIDAGKGKFVVDADNFAFFALYTSSDKFSHCANAFSPMFVTLLGIVIEVTFLLLYRKYEGMDSTSFPIVTVFIDAGKYKFVVDADIFAFFALYTSSDKFSHCVNAFSPMFVTLLGMVTEARPEQPEKAKLPMLVTLLGIATETSPEQP